MCWRNPSRLHFGLVLVFPRCNCGVYFVAVRFAHRFFSLTSSPLPSASC